MKEGDKIRLIHMPNDPAPLPRGATGTVKMILRDQSQAIVEWDPPNEERTLMLLPDVDEWEVVNAA